MITDIRQVMQAMKSSPGTMFKPVSKSSGEEPQTVIFEADDLVLEYESEYNVSEGYLESLPFIELSADWAWRKAVITIDDSYSFVSTTELEFDDDDESVIEYISFVTIASTPSHESSGMWFIAIGNDEGAGTMEMSVQGLDLSGTHSIKIGMTESNAYEGVYTGKIEDDPGVYDYMVSVAEVDVEDNPKRFNSEEEEGASLEVTANGVIIPIESFSLDEYNGVCSLDFECLEFYQAVVANQPCSIKFIDADSKSIAWNNLSFSYHSLPSQNLEIYLHGFFFGG